MDVKRINELYNEVLDRIEEKHIGCFDGMDTPLFLISTQYPGIWLEHLYDSVLYAKMKPERLGIAVNTVNMFLKYQKPDGQLPCYIWNKKFFPDKTDSELIGYGQIQECVSVGALFFEVCQLTGDKKLLSLCYGSVKAWTKWLESNRMTTGRGLIELFCGYDTGHDESGRFLNLACKGNYEVDGRVQNASVLCPDDPVAPILAVDMNCNFYADNMALYRMAEELGLTDEAQIHLRTAKAVKAKLFEHCFDADDCFFYDVDKHGNKIKCRSSTVFHLFLEGVLDTVEDKEIISEIYDRYLADPKEFATPYPYPSVSVSDPTWKKHTESNCWGYFSQGLIALRTTRWMERYGFTEDFEKLLTKWVEAWTAHYDRIKFGQELDPITGEPSPSSEWYSSCMLLYVYAVRRLGIVEYQVQSDNQLP